MMEAKGKQGSLCYFCNSSVSLTVSKIKNFFKYMDHHSNLTGVGSQGF